MKIIGISGTDGSGKDSLGQILANDYGWKFISVTESLREELIKRGVQVTRKNQRLLSAEWRRENGLAVLVDKALKKFEPEKEKYKGLVLASLRNPGEADRIHELGGKMVWIDADPRVRYERISQRNRGGVEDRVSYEEFIAEEKAQTQHSGDEATLSLAGIKAKADIFIENNGVDIEAFKSEVKKALALII